MRDTHPDDYNYFPNSWILPQERENFVNFFQEKSEEKPDELNVFICKPYSSCAGKGIKLVTELKDLPLDGNWVVQEYVNK